jgi:hypothetical protein
MADGACDAVAVAVAVLDRGSLAGWASFLALVMCVLVEERL